MSDIASSSTQVSGGCQCGAVRYAIDAVPEDASVCHCRMCQKAGGAPFMAFFSVPAPRLAWTRGEPTLFASSTMATRGFCRDCGTPLTYRREPAQISVTICSLDDPGAVAPTERLGLEGVLAWSEHVGTLPIQSADAWLASVDPPAFHNHQHPDRDT